ncbi:MAG TPA: restriction endonuclease subunit S [Candidatus Methanoperedens sp.]|nr:restriction endonuclease subunit S [Candidatus Methanoperedens sp.]
MGSGWHFMPADEHEIKIPLPPLPEQRRIAEILSAADRKLEIVKKGLMNELLTGGKRVRV